MQERILATPRFSRLVQYMTVQSAGMFWGSALSRDPRRRFRDRSCRLSVDQGRVAGLQQRGRRAMVARNRFAEEKIRGPTVVR